MAKNDIWTPLESNPDSLYLYSCKLGQSKLKFVDIYGFNNDLLDMIPQPVQAVIFLYPVNDNIVSENNTNDKHNLKENFDNVWFIKQDGRKDHPTVHCFTNGDNFLYDTGKIIQDKFIEKCKDDLRFSALAVIPNDNFDII
ncbi:hypothetical protein PFMC_05680 [Plasmodium falciparum CAMP/Malaysia]|uniref:Ubiquitin carboxyl-terminal hydrolase n=1 Tax=Plasmodium falciparum (isolate Camp / Malaysia) TaxID=5835 RepID=A0A024WZA1_PLAFC|nr:hypothetical protein PFMC_05680 [Plasmodium falciparum CAMP/Malaysia]